ncbi:MAG: nitrite/sulfite reductase [Sandaracinaceae bacterium]|nr:nitrite/sulfite reductase [Sandaracinaceae bacterium]
MASRTWKTHLDSQLPKAMADEINVFETELELRQKGKLEEKLFAETRLRRGVYGQRYDNGLRHDGEAQQPIPFPSGELTKGPMTMWDAPGMQRIKVPYGGLTAAQLEMIADLAEEYSDGIAHITTRQDFQFHFIHIEDTPDLMRRLAAVDITTREACGNSVRNITACPRAGVCHDEPFDTTPYAKAMADFLLGHPDTQDFGRKVKIAFSGCRDHACALTNIHDIGAIGVNRAGKRGFEFYVGGGLGAVPHQAKLLEEFVSEEELLPLSQAVCRVFARLGEKTNRARARLKFVVAKLGIEEFRRIVAEERKLIPNAPEHTAYLGMLHATDEKPIKVSSLLRKGRYPEGFEAWRSTNVYQQRQSGYSLVTIKCPLGDLTSAQLRALADLARKFCGDTIRTTIEQNLVFRWVSNDDLPALYTLLGAIGLNAPGAGTIVDVTSCPGTDTCKLGISASRGLAAELGTRLAEQALTLDKSVQELRIKVSGCFNSCGQHHVGDLGFLGASRAVNGRRVPNFQVVLGGQWKENGGAYGLAIGSVPSKRIPDVVTRLTERFVRERVQEESFQTFIQRIGKLALRKMVEDLIEMPTYQEAPGLYRDWGDPREYTIGDLGVGECAGEVVPFVEFGLAAAERQVFEASTLLEAGDPSGAAERAYRAMLHAAQALTRHVGAFVTDAPDDIVAQFRTYLVEPKFFWDPFAGEKFVHYLTRVHGTTFEGVTSERAHQRIEEAQLFVDASNQAYARVGEARQKAAADAKVVTA